ncbi:11974_t:CDS:1, partial [Diversispora eburnea]
IEPIDDKPEPPSEIIEPSNDEVEPFPDLSANDEPKSSNEEAITQLETVPSSLPTRAERESSLRECAVKHGEDPDKFVTITEKDRDLAMIFRDKMMSDADMIDFARNDGDDPEEYMELSRREKLICIEIKLRMHEDDGKPRADAYDDEEWKKNIAILQENRYLW